MSHCKSDINGNWIAWLGISAHSPYHFELPPLTIICSEQWKDCTRGQHNENMAVPVAKWTWLQNAGTDFHCNSILKLVKQWQGVWIIMRIMWKSDITSLINENGIYFRTCTLVLMYYTHDHYFQYSPHRISKIVGLKNWRPVTLKNTLLLHPRGDEWIQNVTVANAGLVQWQNLFLGWEHRGDGRWWESWTNEGTNGLTTKTDRIPHVPKSQLLQTLNHWFMNRIHEPYLAEHQQDPSAEN